MTTPFMTLAQRMAANRPELGRIVYPTTPLIGAPLLSRLEKHATAIENRGSRVDAPLAAFDVRTCHGRGHDIRECECGEVA